MNSPKVIEVGTNNDKWIVCPMSDLAQAKLSVLEITCRQEPSVLDGGDISDTVRHVLESESHAKKFVVIDTADDVVYSNAPPHITPFTATAHGYKWIGACVVVGFDTQSWDSITPPK